MYLKANKRVTWPKGAAEQSLDFALTRGTVIRGTVVEEGTGRPIAGAMVTFAGNNTASDTTRTSADGAFELAVWPRTGHLGVHAPSDDYIEHELGYHQIHQIAGGAGGQRQYANASIACDPKPGGPALNLHIALRRGMTVSGRIIGPDHQLIQNVWIIGRAALGPSPSAWRGWNGSYHALAQVVTSSCTGSTLIPMFRSIFLNHGEGLRRRST